MQTYTEAVLVFLSTSGMVNFSASLCAFFDLHPSPSGLAGIARFFLHSFERELDF